jgi:hypothetical protein
VESIYRTQFPDERLIAECVKRLDGDLPKYVGAPTVEIEHFGQRETVDRNRLPKDGEGTPQPGEGIMGRHCNAVCALGEAHMAPAASAAHRGKRKKSGFQLSPGNRDRPFPSNFFAVSFEKSSVAW